MKFISRMICRGKSLRCVSHWIVLLLPCVAIFAGCGGAKYSALEHEPYTSNGTASIKLIMADEEWTCRGNQVLLCPDTKYGAAFIDGKIPESKVDRNFAKLARTCTITNGGCSFYNLPKGSYLIGCTLILDDTIPGGVVAQENSPMLLSGLAAGRSLSVNTRYGTFTRNGYGSWSPDLVKRKIRHFRKTINVSGNVTQDIPIEIVEAKPERDIFFLTK